MLICLISGCGCNKISEENYQGAVSTFKNTDGLSFSRLEIIRKKGETTYERKKTDAKYVFDSGKNVKFMQYAKTEGEGNNSGGVSIKKTTKYYYNIDDSYFYVHSIVGESELNRYKEVASSYNEKFNVNVCDDIDKDCLLLVSTNLAPVFNLNEVSDFSINDDGVATFNAICPSFEHCSGNSQVLEYVVTLDDDGNIGFIEYEIENGDLIYSIKYSFDGYGSNNVSVNFPSDLESYIKK